MNCSTDPRAIAAVVVSHESAATLDDCLLRLRAARDVAEIRVVDNASQDDTLEIVQRHALADPRLRFIANPDNPGFAVGCNQGAGDSSAPWLAFVNPDLRVEADTLARLRDHAVALGGPALLGVDLVGEDGRRDPAARRRDPDFAAMLASPARAALDVPRDPELAVQPVEAISGALMLLPRDLFARLGGLDEGYRLHAEDLDLCRRARMAGARVAVVNELAVVHVRGVSSRARPLFVEWHKHRGLWRYFRKFEASRRSVFTHATVAGAIWAHFAAVWLKRMLGRR
ncbi:glycosyltransferase family 2 protein [Pseudoxanthomonas mexicana]|uniref:glycosyltransferase family 2 protein n=1 Tax=Pseudoxanthomonas mexicana TaxID=128785 RepID=UPI00398ADC60